MMKNTKYTDGQFTGTYAEWMTQMTPGQFAVAFLNGYIEDVIESNPVDAPPFM